MPTRTRKKGPVAPPLPAAPQTATTLAAGPVTAWRVTGASVQGVSHQRLDLPCQDALGYRALDGGILLVALADGAGSAEFSLEGAQALVDESLRVMEERLANQGAQDEIDGWKNLMRDAFVAARELVLAGALAGGQNPRAYAATLTGLIASGERLVAGQIGDGAVVVEDENGEMLSLMRLQRGEYANETHFLVQEDALDQIVIEVFDQPVRGLAVMSDGLIRLALKMPAQEPHMPFFQPLFRFAHAATDVEAAAGQLAEFLASERVNERTDDDKSLVLAVRVSGEGIGK